jgi:site-specific recombinase XerD
LTDEICLHPKTLQEDKMSGSMVDQAARLFRRHRGTSESRRAWREAHHGFGKMAPKTFAWNSERRYKSAAIQFVKWCHERHGLREIRQITTPLVVAYIDKRKASGLSPRTIATDITALRRLGWYAEMDKWVPCNFVPQDLSMPHGSSPRYSYTPEHETAIIQHVAQRNSLAADVLRLQQAAGLRLDEAIHVRLDRVDFERGTVEVKGKGGKIRCVTVVDRTVLDLLDRSRRYPLLNGLASNWKRYIEKLVFEACMELQIKPLGTHAFRAGAAQRLFDDLMAQGLKERQARKQVSQMLGHNRISVTRSYAP